MKISRKKTKMAKKATKLNYKYVHAPCKAWKGNPHEWYQDMSFKIGIGPMNKKTLLKTRAQLVKDVAKVFAKYGIDAEAFNCQNEWI